jgi:hypothetical protein
MNSLSPLLLVASLLSGADASADANNPRALVQRAVKAAGLDRQPPQHVLHYRLKGKMSLGVAQLGGQDKPITLDGEMFIHSSRRVKMRLAPTILGNEITTTVVLDGDRSWSQMAGSVTDLDPQLKENLTRGLYRERITDLTPLLTDKAFTLAALGESKVDDRPVLGVKVSCSGREDVNLYFDRKNGLLVKYSYQEKEPPAEKSVLHEIYLRDYHVPDLLGPALAKLKAAHLDTSDDALVSYLRKLTPRADDLRRARKLVSQLGDDSFEQREKASRELLTLGTVARPLLEEAAKSDDPEVVRRARQCLQKIKAGHSDEALISVIQVLALRRPAGAVEAILDYLPGAEARLVAEARAALVALAEGDDKQRAVLVRALEDRDPLRRATAAAVLGKDGGVYLKQPGRRLYLRAPLQPMKTVSHQDGKSHMELEMRDIEFFNAFEDKVFARPKGP